MTISAINSFTPAPYKKPLRFGFMASVDIGSSNGMTAKTAFFTNEGEYIRLVIPENEKSVHVRTIDRDDALQNLANVIRRRLGDPSLGRLPVEQKELKSMYFFIPDRPESNGEVPMIFNVKIRDGDALRGLRLDQMAQKLPRQLKNGVTIPESFKIVAINDMGGGTLAACADVSQKYPRLFKPGMRMLYVMSGGGLGVAKANFIQVKGTQMDGTTTPIVRNELQLQLTQIGSAPWLEQDGQVKDYEAVGGKPGFVNTFIEEFPNAVKRPIRELDTAGRRYPDTVVTMYESKGNLKGAGEVFPKLEREDYKDAAHVAIDRYIDSIAMLTARSLHEGTTILVLAGGIASGVKSFVGLDRTQAFKKDLDQYAENRLIQQNRYSKFDKVLASRIWSKLNERGKTEYLHNRFQIISDIEVKNNTLGAPYLAQAQPTSENDLWIVPATAFTNPFAGVGQE